MTFIKITKVKPGVLVNPYPVIVGIWRQDLLKLVFGIRQGECDLVVTRGHVFFVREDPDLKEFDQFVFVLVVF